MSRAKPEAPRAATLRRRILLASLLAASVVILARAFTLQVLGANNWRARAQGQQADSITLPARRGAIYDRDGVPLAASQEAFGISIAPQEVQERGKLVALLRKHAGLSNADAQRALNPAKRWIVLSGRYNAATRHALSGIRGVYFERALRRFHPRGEIATELLGLVSGDDRALGGLELEFDAELRGESGRALSRRDARGRAIPGAYREVIEPLPGHDLHLTIDADLQEIAREALADAIERTSSTSGELVMSDPRTGEVLAAVSSKSGIRSWRAVTEPYEPGSTLKPFAVATLLAERRVRLTDRVFAEHGSYTRDRRTIEDAHPNDGWLTIADALKYSSNVVLAKLSERVEPELQYTYLRAFGFGSPTAVTYPSESAGLLRRPSEWSRYSQASLAIGYEISVTPLQLLMAYGALANGGVLMEPRLVREVRTHDGRVVRALPPQAVRRVIPERIANQLRNVLADAVTSGTARGAALGPFAVAGKTGTARSAAGGHYRQGVYFSSFAGFFPADDPQLVFLVKLDSPRGEYYGGLTAAPVTRATLEAALAALSTPLDKRTVASAAPPPLAVARAKTEERAEAPSGPFIFALNPGSQRRHVATAQSDSAAVPDVTDLPLRDAVRRLHSLGFQVRVQGRGVVTRSEPLKGAMLPKGGLVRLAASEVKS